MRIAICDDDVFQLQDVHKRTADFFDDQNIEIIDFTDGGEFLEFINNSKDGFDIFITDIELQGKYSGIDLAKVANNLFPKCRVIYITGYIEYASEVYDTDHDFFVVKTRLDTAFNKALLKAVESLKKKYHKLFIVSKYEKKLVDIDEILYVERDLRKTKIHTVDGITETNESIDELLEKLDIYNFIRCHNSCAVNLERIKTYKNSMFHFETGEVVVVSRSYKKKVDACFMDYMRKSIIL